ncbi:hypothetical protein ACIPVB_09100 [Microbacterium sp. NPDC090007]|uniref:hypothetical protein n=1 Tax=Microbacterium sp. NPDC090007 TaxID=3364204 RepID=UPI0037FE31CD
MSWGIHLETDNGEVVEVFDGHTYNLSPMWRLAGVFEKHSVELDGMAAHEIGLRASRGLLRAVTRPDVYRHLNPENGWGNFDGFVEMLTRLAIRCADNPTAIARWNG